MRDENLHRYTPLIMPRPKPLRSASTLALADAIDRDARLGALMQSLRTSEQCLQALQPLLPPALRGQLRAGPLDEGGWSLLAPSSAAASKLRQLLPMLEATLAAARLPGVPIRIKVQPPR
jgi:hypothetical protein